MVTLDILAKLSNRYGSNPEYVLAGGGNTSCKNGKYLFVKGSGTSLATITAEGFVKMQRAKLRKIFDKKYPENADAREAEVLSDMLASRVKGETKRPSVETLLHEAIPFRYVLHLHPTAANGLACSVNGKAVFEKHFSENGIWIDPVMPGYILAVTVRDRIRRFTESRGRAPDLILLQNHGIFLGADTERSLDKKLRAFFRTLKDLEPVAPSQTPEPFDRVRAASFGAQIRGICGGFAVFFLDSDISEAVSSGSAFGRVYTTFSPDHMVYCSDAAAFSGASEEEISAALAGYRAEKGVYPRVLGVEGLGCYAIAPTKREADVAAAVFRDAARVSVYARNFGGPVPLPDMLVDAINNWEVERYRKSVAFAPAASARAANKIAVVTGGAQGFGRAIAESLAAQGAFVCIADLNAGGAEAAAEEICRVRGKGAAIGVAADVSNEEDVRNMICAAVCEYGGVDILISNAGIVRAGGLDELRLSDFELCTRINYTAFFLCCKYASQIMKINGKYDPSRYFDIIQINSKSGLAGSNRNFAYAGSKFGGIGLVQSYALELAPSRIKVNAVCPGNFLDGPLWSDPEKGLFVQYLKAGKVPGAKTEADVKAFYEAKVPLRRGCLPEDVMHAIFYLIEQQYETGQAVPVTGGQQMLH